MRNFNALPHCKVKFVVEESEERREFVKRMFSSVKTSCLLSEALEDSEVEAVIIATPAQTHFRIAKTALLAGKHVLAEKPLALKSSEVDDLAQISEQRGLVLMVGHTFLYHAAVRYVKSLIDSGEIGEIRYIYSQRLNLGRIRSDIDAMWNFMPHDLSIIQYWLGERKAVSVVRHGMDFLQKGIEDVVFLNIKYEDRIIANIHVSWLDPQKVRKIIVVGSKKMVVYDDVADDKIAIYDKGIDRKAILGSNMEFDQSSVQFAYRSGDIVLPRICMTEPLQVEAEHFLNCIRTNAEPITGVRHARKIVAILERAAESLWVPNE